MYKPMQFKHKTIYWKPNKLSPQMNRKNVHPEQH